MSRPRANASCGNLPESVTSFVGRSAEIAATKRRMSESRMVTLTGVGGVGKTRLALEVAGASRRAFADGVWMVDLAPLSDPSRLTLTVLSALDVRDLSGRDPDAVLIEHLKGRRLLLLLDNCEHLLDACAALVAGVLRRAPGLHVLATSREALGIDGEHIFTVPALSLPDPSRPGSVEDLGRYDAVKLLVDRARAVRADFALTAENAQAVAQLCAWLDGMPLAIELAATRLRSLSPEAVVTRLDDRFSFLAGGSRAAAPRQQTLRALIDWSHELCTPQERLLWARLSVFPGSFDLEAAEQICADDELRTHALADVLDHLVAKSLVLAECAGEQQRYRLLVSVREYGAEKLESYEAADLLRSRHRDHYLCQAVQMCERWSSPDQAHLLEQMRLDHPNVRAALEWSINASGQGGRSAEFAVALRWHWVVGGFLTEGTRWMRQVLEVSDSTTAQYGHALWVAAWLDLVQGQRESAGRRLAEAASIADALNDEVLHAHVLQWTGLLRFFSRDAPGAVPLLERAVARHALAGETSGALFSLFQLAVARIYAGDLVRARRNAEEAIERSIGYGERWARAYALMAIGIVEWREGNVRAAEEYEREALEIQRDFEDGICTGLSMDAFAWIAASRGDHATAAMRLGAANAVWGRIGTSIDAFGPLADDAAHAAGQIRGVLGPQRSDTLLADSQGLGIASAISLALTGRVSAQSDGTSAFDPLSPREREVAELVTKGLSNKAIAERLVLSPRTIDGHLERIFAKLGISSRAQLAAWAVEQLTRTR